MEREQQERFADAVERKKREARERSQQAPGPGAGGGPEVHGEIQASEVEAGRPQDAYDVRAKNSRKGHVTADNWNQ
ncbi:MAG: hypothetical protein QOC64_1272 [Solirubrobacteraceae bacterium]|jgi:hypothetical protein|nr:hypothetical protein [Solirubrobacteraceae bacterium]